MNSYDKTDLNNKNKPTDKSPSVILGNWSLLAGLFSLPSVILPSVGIIPAGAAIALSLISRNISSSEGHHFLTRAKIGMLLGIFSCIIILLIVYSYVHVMNNLSYYHEFINNLGNSLL